MKQQFQEIAIGDNVNVSSPPWSIPCIKISSFWPKERVFSVKWRNEVKNNRKDRPDKLIIGCLYRQCHFDLFGINKRISLNIECPPFSRAIADKFYHVAKDI